VIVSDGEALGDGDIRLSDVLHVEIDVASMIATPSHKRNFPVNLFLFRNMTTLGHLHLCSR
jgi:hypothetical protein